MGSTRWFRNKLLGVLALTLGLVLMLTSCSLFAPSQDATSAPSEPSRTATTTSSAKDSAVQVEFPGRGDLQAVTEAVEQTPEMTEAAPAKIRVVIDINLLEGEFPDTGAIVTFELDEPGDEVSAPVIAHWNEDTAEWEVQPTTLAADGKSISAQVEHFSIFAVIEDVYNAVNKVVGNFTERPECPREAPDWAETTFLDDQNGPVLWCVMVDENNRDILEVRIVANRSSAMMVATTVAPVWGHSDVFGDMGPGTWFSTTFGGASLQADYTNRYMIPPKGEYRFGFAKDDLFEFWRTGQGKPLIQVDVSSGTAVVGLIYGAAAEGASPLVAGAITAITVAECGHGIYNAGVDSTFSSVTSTVTGCISDRKDVIAKSLTEEIMARDSVSWTEATKAATASGSRIGFALGIYTLSKAHLTLGSIIGDMLIDPTAFQLHFTPSTALIQERLFGAGQRGALAELCGSSCAVTGEAPVEHPAWGQVRIVTLLPNQAMSGSGYIAAVDDADRILWSAETDRMYELEPAATAQDATGNVFLNFNPGRHNGVIVLKPTQQGFDDLDTLPSDTYQKRFYYAAAVGEPEGEVVIWHFSNNCDPSCAEGTITKEQFRWNGSDYVSAGPPEEITWPDEHYSTIP